MKFNNLAVGDYFVVAKDVETSSVVSLFRKIEPVRDKERLHRNAIECSSGWLKFLYGDEVEVVRVRA